MRPLIRSLAARLHQRGRQEGGTVIVIVAGCLVMFLALLAYTIDLSAGRQVQQKAQAAADAGALVGANALGQHTTGATFTTLVNQMVKTNDPNAATPQITTDPSTDAVTVTVSDVSRGSFGASFGRSNEPVSALAVASPGTAVTTTTSTVTGTTSGTVTNTTTATITNTTTATVTRTTTGTVTSSQCAQAGTGCLAIYASNTTCGGDSSETSDPVVFGGGVTVSGGVWSNGSLDLGGGGSVFGPLTYATGCSISPTKNSDGTTNPPAYKQNSNTFNDGYPVAAAKLSGWPINYALDFPSCSGSSCTGPLKTPSFCTQASKSTSWSINTYTPVTLFANQIYCAVGSGTASTPSSWNGALSIEGGGNNFDSTYVAGSITVLGGSNLTACGYSLPTYSAANCGAVPAPVTDNYPLFYATKGTVNESSGGNALTGDWFVPSGSISVGGGTNFIGFLEAQIVNLSAGGIQGDGPASSGGVIGTTSVTTSTTTSVTTGYPTSVTTGYPTSVTTVYSPTTLTGTSTTTTGSDLTH